VPGGERTVLRARIHTAWRAAPPVDAAFRGAREPT
jgi:hypothetical protein